MNAALPTETQVLGALRRVADPEVGINIVDLGLIYAVAIDDKGIRLRMTLTSPACPTGTLLLEEAQAAVAAIAGSLPVDVECVWEPPWGPERISDAAKKTLGW